MCNHNKTNRPMKKVELIVRVHGSSVPDGKDRVMVVIGEPVDPVTPNLQPEFDLEPGGYVAIAFSSYKIDEERSSKDRTSYIGHEWNPATGNMVIKPRKDSYKATVTFRKIV